MVCTCTTSAAASSSWHSQTRTHNATEMETRMNSHQQLVQQEQQGDLRLFPTLSLGGGRERFAGHWLVLYSVLCMYIHLPQRPSASTVFIEKARDRFKERSIPRVRVKAQNARYGCRTRHSRKLRLLCSNDANESFERS